MILSATRPQIELYVRVMEGRGLAATTIDRRLSTVCGFYRFAHIDGRIASNPAQYVRAPKFIRTMPGALTAPSLGRSWRDHRTLRIVGKGNKPAVIPLVPRTARTIDLRSGSARPGDLAPSRRQSARPSNSAPVGPLDRQTSGARPGAPPHVAGRVHHVRPRGGGPVARRADRSAPCRPPNDDGLRPPSPELRQACGVRRGRLRGGWIMNQRWNRHDCPRGAADSGQFGTLRPMPLGGIDGLMGARLGHGQRLWNGHRSRRSGGRLDSHLWPEKRGWEERLEPVPKVMRHLARRNWAPDAGSASAIRDAWASWTPSSDATFMPVVRRRARFGLR